MTPQKKSTQKKRSSAAQKKGAENEKPKQQRKVQPIVAIGASAGGLDAMQRFFEKMPSDSGIGFIVITHTKPERESMLPELLSNVTRMNVTHGSDGMKIEPNKIIVAKDSLLTIENSKLYHVKADDTPEVSHHPIDYFLRSLANDQHEHGICIILSGSGNDGTLGLKAIKAAGGMAMVQEPGSAKYPGMPESARATGLVDYVLPADELPDALVEYCKGPFLKLARREEAAPLPDDAAHAILVRLRSHTGQDFTYYKKSTMTRRIERRMNVHRIKEPQVYLAYLRENPRELDLLLQELLISVTSFFRDPEAFDSLANKAIPKLLDRRNDGHTLRVWIPGCATGEEAYSVAILLDEQIRKIERLHEVQIFATDLDKQAIETARNGLYPEGISVDVPKERLQRYFSKEDGSYRIHKNIRDMIVFAVQNVVSDPPFTRMDLIVCRNVLIYLNPDAQGHLLPLFHYALRPDGLLFLGSSESITGSEDLFETIDGKYKIMRRKDASRPIHPAITQLTRHEPETEEASHKDIRFDASSRNLTRTVERLLLSQFAPCSAVVDERDTAIYFHGRSGLYFQPEQGQPRNNILEMAREGLRLPLARALRQARKEEKEVTKRGIRVRTNGDSAEADVTVRPIRSPESIRGLMLITIRSIDDVPIRILPAPEQRAPKDGLEREDLERELQFTRENLQTTIEELETSNEELRSSNEELQSTNEELQSSNEELETSREEMQSLNEELNTVNAELKSKVEALARSNDDMNNLLNNMQVATIFLDNDLRVKRYTKQARDIVRLIETDIGRPLEDLTSKLRYDELIDDCQKVLATLTPKEKEVEDENGRNFLVRILPYRTADNVIDGLVLTIVDIDRTKRAEQRAQVNREFFESIVRTVRHPLMVLDSELRVKQANSAFYEAFDTKSNQTENKLIYELGNRQWDIPELRELLEDILPNKIVMMDFRVEHKFPNIGKRVFLLNAREMRHPSPDSNMILLAFEDVTNSEKGK